MICVGRKFMTLIGMSEVEIELARNTPDCNGFASSDLFSFGGGGNDGKDTAVLDAEPAPRRLVLVAMADRYSEAERRGAVVEQLCVSSEGAERLPTDTEKARLIEELGKVDHPVASIIQQRLVVI